MSQKRESEPVGTVVVFSGFFYPHVGGHERYIEELWSRVSNDRRRVIVITCNTEGGPLEEEYRGFRIYRLPCWQLLQRTLPVPTFSRQLRRVLDMVRQERITIVNTHTRFFPIHLIGVWLAWRTKARLIHTEHGTQHVALHNAIARMLAWLYDHTIGSLVIRSAACVVGVSEASVAFAKHLGAKRTMLFYNGVNTHDFRPAERTYGTTTSIVFVGRLIAAKGVHILLEALKGITTPQPVELHIIGSGPHESQLRALADRNTAIAWHGQLSPMQVRDVLQQCQIFVNPSFAEGFPTSVLEAGACGCAVIATDVGGTKELIADARYGILVPPANTHALRTALQHLVADSAQQERLGQSLRHRIVEHWDWDSIANTFQVQLNSWERAR